MMYTDLGGHFITVEPTRYTRFELDGFFGDYFKNSALDNFFKHSHVTPHFKGNQTVSSKKNRSKGQK